MTTVPSCRSIGVKMKYIELGFVLVGYEELVPLLDMLPYLVAWISNKMNPSRTIEVAGR